MENKHFLVWWIKICQWMKEQSWTKLQGRLTALIHFLWRGQYYMQQASGQSSPNASFDLFSKHSNPSFDTCVCVCCLELKREQIASLINLLVWIEYLACCTKEEKHLHRREIRSCKHYFALVAAGLCNAELLGQPVLCGLVFIFSGRSDLTQIS